MNEKNSLVSIIVPCYNYGHFVIEALQSVRSQSYTYWECIVVNDGSTDNSKEVIESFIGEDIRFQLYNIPNGGVSAARNIGIQKAKGKYIFPLDADNKLHPDCLFRCIKEFERSPYIKLVYTEAELFGDESGLWNLPPFDYKTMLQYNMVDNSSLFLKADFDKVGGYRTNMVHGLEDWDFFIALLYGCTNAQVIKIKEPLYYYRMSSSSRGASAVSTGKKKEMLDLLVYNNFSIYQEYFPDIFHRVLKYDYQNRMLNKWPLRWMVKIMNWFSSQKSQLIK